MKTLKLLTITFTFLLCFSFVYQSTTLAAIQYARVDPGYMTGSTLAGSLVSTIAVDGEDNVFVGGDITNFYRTKLYNLAKFNPDGNLDPDFYIGTGFNGKVEVIKLQQDGKILVGGQFTKFDGQTVNYFVRLLATGHIDQTFDVSDRPNTFVKGIEILDDGKSVIIGDFTSIGGVSHKYLARYNNDGTLDSTFNQGTGLNNVTTAVTVQVDGKLLVGGFFSSYNSVSVGNLIRINEDGSLDTSFSVGTGFNSTTRRIRALSTGEILVGGWSFSYNGDTTKRYLIRLNSDGSLDTSFDTSLYFNNYVYDFVLDTDGDIYVGGNFTGYGSSFWVHRYAKLSSLGVYDSLYSQSHLGNNAGFNGLVESTAIDSEGRVYYGGSFGKFSGQSTPLLARALPDGSIDSSFIIEEYGPDGTVLASDMQDDGKLVIGGDFTYYDGLSTNRIVRLDSVGRRDSSFTIGTGFNGRVNEIKIVEDGNILVGGEYTQFNSASASRLVKLNPDGTKNTSFNMGTGPNSNVTVIEMASDGKYLIGGVFATYGGVSSPRLVRVNPDGSLDNTFSVGTGLSSTPYVIREMADGKILVGGIFTTYNGVGANYIVRLNANGSIDNTFIYGTGFNSWVYDIKVTDDQKIYVAGLFSTYNGNAVKNILRLNTDGTIDDSFDIGSGPSNSPSTSRVSAILLQSDGKLILSGIFNSFNGELNNNIVRVNSGGSIDNSFDIGSGSDGEISKSYFLNNEEEVLILGLFKSFNSITSRSIARITSPMHFQVANLDELLDVVHEGISIKVGTRNALLNPNVSAKLLLADGIPISDFILDLTQSDIDFAGVFGEKDDELGKAYVAGLLKSEIPLLSETHSLYVPYSEGHNSVYVCPNALSLEDIFIDCEGGLSLVEGVAPNISIVSVEGVDYWKVTELTGTGALSTFVLPEENNDEGEGEGEGEGDDQAGDNGNGEDQDGELDDNDSDEDTDNGTDNDTAIISTNYISYSTDISDIEEEITLDEEDVTSDDGDPNTGKNDISKEDDKKKSTEKSKGNSYFWPIFAAVLLLPTLFYIVLFYRRNKKGA